MFDWDLGAIEGRLTWWSRLPTLISYDCISWLMKVGYRT